MKKHPAPNSKKPPDDSAKMLRLQRRLGERIGRLRLRHTPPLHQNELARLAGIDPATMNQIERGHRMPDIRTIYRIAEVLGMTAGSILDGETISKDASKPEEPRERPDLSATIQATTHAALSDIAHAILDALTARAEEESRRQITSTGTDPAARAAGH